MRTKLAAVALLGAGLLCGATTAAPALAEPAQVHAPTPEGTKGSKGCTKYETEESSVKICKLSEGKFVYHGSSAVGAIRLPATETSSGTFRTKVNNGHVYTIDSEELVITRNGKVISEQPVISVKTSKKSKPTQKPAEKPFVPNAETPRDEGSYNYQAPGTSCVQKGTTIKCTTPYGSYSYTP